MTERSNEHNRGSRGSALATHGATLPPLQLRTQQELQPQQPQQEACTTPMSLPTPPLMTPTSPRRRHHHGGVQKLRAVGRSVTKAPRLLGRRIKHFLRDDLQMDVHYYKQPARDVTRTLATLELLAMYHRWLRGVQAFLSLVVFALSLMSVSTSSTLVNAAMLLLSELTCLVIVKTYDVKAQFCGATNVLFAGRNVLSSPFFFHMAAELVVWNVQTPPIVLFWRPFFDVLNYFVFLRLYAVVLYLNNALYVYRTFCRAVSALCDAPLNTSFLLRTALVYNARRVVCTAALLLWLTVGCMYAKAEATSLGDGLWFAFQTLATLGYGDYTPAHFAGRVVVALAWCGSTALLSYIIVLAHASADADAANVSLLLRCHALTHERRTAAARVVQCAWRFCRAQRAWQRRQEQKRQQQQQQQQQQHVSHGADDDDGGVVLTSSNNNSNLTTTTMVRVRQFMRDTAPLRGAIVYRSWCLTFAIAAAQRTRRRLSDTQRRFREPPRVSAHTGLSAYQRSLHDGDVERRARQVQRVKDVERVYAALRDVHAPASSLSRRDVASWLLRPDDHVVWQCDDGGGGNNNNNNKSSNSGDAATTAAAAAPRNTVWLVTAGDGAAAAAATQQQQQQRRLAAVEAKCAQLTELLDTLLSSATADEATST